MKVKQIHQKTTIPSSLTDFEILHILGKGSFGTVFKGKHKGSNVIYAVKQIPLALIKEKEKDNSLNEIRILASLSSPYIIAYQDSFFDEYSNTLNIIMEYADNGDLEQLISRKRSQKGYLSEVQAMQYILPVVKGLRTLHENHILHRDLKLANIFLFKNGEVKIGDMNVSKVFKNDLKSTQTGTPYYACPEVWNNSCYDYKADIWSLGCLIYELLTFKAPFRGTSLKVVYDQVNSGTFDQLPSYLSTTIKLVITRCLSVNPFNRPTIQEIEKAIDYNLKENKEGNGDQEDNRELLSTIIMNNKRSFNEMNLILPKKSYFRKIMPLEINHSKLINPKEVIKYTNSNNNITDKQLKISNNNHTTIQHSQSNIELNIKPLLKGCNNNKLFKLNYHYRHLNDNPIMASQANHIDINNSNNDNKQKENQVNEIQTEPNALVTKLTPLKANYSESCYKKISNIRKSMFDNSKYSSSIEETIQINKDNKKPNNKNNQRPYSVNIRHMNNKNENMKCIFNNNNNNSIISNQYTNDITLPSIKLNGCSNRNNKQNIKEKKFAIIPPIIYKNNSSQIANVFNYYYPLHK